MGILFRFVKFTSENAIGSKSEAQRLNRIGISLIVGESRYQLRTNVFF